MSTRRPARATLLVVLSLAWWSGPGLGTARAQFGLAVSGVGPIHRSMGGAAVAAPLDASGAID